MINYWISPISKSLNYLSPIKNKLTLNKQVKKTPNFVTNQLRYFYFTKYEKYMELEYTYKGNIVLDEKEQQIFDILREVVEKNNLNTTMRVAGGWVRDKVIFSRKNSKFDNNLAFGS
jgi:hypothetical protein